MMNNILDTLSTLFDTISSIGDDDPVYVLREIACIEKRVRELVEDNETYILALEKLGVTPEAAKQIAWGRKTLSLRLNPDYHDQWDMVGDDVWIAVEDYNIHVDNVGAGIAVDAWDDDRTEVEPVESMFLYLDDKEEEDDGLVQSN